MTILLTPLLLLEPHPLVSAARAIVKQGSDNPHLVKTQAQRPLLEQHPQVLPHLEPVEVSLVVLAHSRVQDRLHLERRVALPVLLDNHPKPLHLAHLVLRQPPPRLGPLQLLLQVLRSEVRWLHPLRLPLGLAILLRLLSEKHLSVPLRLHLPHFLQPLLPHLRLVPHLPPPPRLAKQVLARVLAVQSSQRRGHLEAVAEAFRHSAVNHQLSVPAPGTAHNPPMHSPLLLPTEKISPAHLV
ncbi:hypothetical protein DL96DRAFT_913695 [Flagelloscypha sp. PMI_526]|nr:hypothetical protein DL96DRAFT_913695 [Flagelloscypha sp. PMI_526]